MAEPQIDEETRKAAEAAKLSQTARKWIAEITAAEKSAQRWMTRAKKIQKRYKKEDSADESKRKYAMLYSNTQTLLPAMYARPPQPVVVRRFKDADKVGRIASEVLERALSYSVDKGEMDSTLRTCVLDFALVARGQAWERYVPTYGDEIVPRVPVLQITDDAGVKYQNEETGEPVEDDDEIKSDDDGEYMDGEAYRPVVYEESVTDYVNWHDFLHGPARTWNEVPWVARRVFMCREELEERFGENLGKLVPLDWGPIEQGKSDDSSRLQKKAAVYEIWCKVSRTVYWVSKSWNSRVLDEREDPLGLDGFFPCPKPLLGTVANDNLFPTPDYVYYQDQAEEVDDLTAKIADLQDALKVVGLYAGDQKSVIPDLTNAKNGTLIPVAAWQTLKEGGGLSAKVEWWPIDKVIQVLQACVQLRAQIIEDIFQITGVADIMRGASDPRETAAAQGMKARWGALRVRERQSEIARFARDIIRIKGEVMAEHFSAETFAKMTGVQLPTEAEKQQVMMQVQQAQILAQAQMQAQQGPMPGQNVPTPQVQQPPKEALDLLEKPSWEEVTALLQDNALRQFRIDIETDSTIEPDEMEEKQQAIELVGAVSSFVQSWGPVIAAQPAMAPMAGELLKFALRKFRAGRQIEDVVEQTMDQLMSQPPPQAEAPQAPPGPTPQEMAIETAKIENERMKIVGEQAFDQADLAIRQQDQQLKLVAMQRDPRPQVTA